MGQTQAERREDFGRLPRTVERVRESSHEAGPVGHSPVPVSRDRTPQDKEGECLPQTRSRNLTTGARGPRG